MKAKMDYREVCLTVYDEQEREVELWVEYCIEKEWAMVIDYNSWSTPGVKEIKVINSYGQLRPFLNGVAFEASEDDKECWHDDIQRAIEKDFEKLIQSEVA